MRLKNKFPKQEESPVRNFSAQKDERAQDRQLTVKDQRKLRKIWSLNLLKALSDGVVEKPHSVPAASTEP
ncbi:MAG: hypothetical protein A2X86_20640 [Bdellovibrionales bacterium GWA2_49_15]|nr:MAG: hypothetical protein A2X86_20640 [Bdellovibrionales bacterium GWA2_49_15]HAZ11276.1 hypothetical protein [Bdellovibrionales bacterium]